MFFLVGVITSITLVDEVDNVASAFEPHTGGQHREDIKTPDRSPTIASIDAAIKHIFDSVARHRPEARRQQYLPQTRTRMRPWRMGIVVLLYTFCLTTFAPSQTSLKTVQNRGKLIRLARGLGSFAIVIL